MEVRFWGVRGSVAASGAQVARIGGNTSCVEVTHGGHRLILDAGTGVRGLGEWMVKAGELEATMLWSHLHWDHVQGFPFFAPAYLPSAKLVLFGPGERGDVALREGLERQMQPPSFPVPLSAMRAALELRSAVPFRPFDAGPFRILPVALPHPMVEAMAEEARAYCTGAEPAREGKRIVLCG